MYSTSNVASFTSYDRLKMLVYEDAIENRKYL